METETTQPTDDEQVQIVDEAGHEVGDDDHPLPQHGHAGRPPLVINLQKLHAVAATFASYEEIAGFFGCHPDTLRRRYSREIERGRQMGRLSYRQLAYTRARISDRVLIHMYDRHVEAPPPKGEAVIQIVSDGRPLIVREVDEDSDTMR